MKDLVKYRCYVEQMFDENSSAIVSNSCTDHAAVLIETMLARAKDRVDIFCQHLDSRIYDKDSIMAQFLKTGQKHIPIRVLIQNEPKAKNLLKAVSAWFGDKVEMPIVFRTCPDSSAARHVDINFIVTDGKSFRYESDLKNHVATASANNPDIASKLTGLFEQFWKDGEAVSL